MQTLRRLLYVAAGAPLRAELAFLLKASRPGLWLTASSRPYSNREMRFFMLGWNAIALVSMPWMWAKAVLL